MSEKSSEESHIAHGVGHHVVGLVICIVLTAIAFGVVMWSDLSRSESLIVVGFAGVAQLLVQLHFFLGIGSASMRGDRGISLLFAALLILIMIGGTLWIMADLGRRMMGS